MKSRAEFYGTAHQPTQFRSIELNLRPFLGFLRKVRMSYIPVSKESHFSIKNIPFGIFSSKSNSTPRPATAIGDFVLDLSALAKEGAFDKVPGFDASTLQQPTLNAFAVTGRKTVSAVRSTIIDLLSENTSNPSVLRDNKSLRQSAFYSQKDVTMHLPMFIRDYTDFYAGRDHAFRVGTMYRGPQNALQPNYYHIPVGYHGRASSVVVSGVNIKRPNGQITDMRAEKKVPKWGPCRKLDIELEVAAFVGQPNEMGEPIPIANAKDHLFGVVLMNDWSARDIQAWEYVPLGPFNGKNFGTTISPWVITFDALEPFATELPGRQVPILDYLKDPAVKPGFSARLDVLVVPSGSSKAVKVLESDTKYLYWSLAQMLAHHTVGGCPMNPGDLLGSGTISGPDESSLGSFLELSYDGKKEWEVDGQKRTFLEDGDEVVFVGYAGEGVGFGECRGKIKAADPIPS